MARQQKKNKQRKPAVLKAGGEPEAPAAGPARGRAARRNPRDGSAAVKEERTPLRERQEKKDLFTLFMEKIPGACFIKDRDGRYLYGNEVWKRQFEPPLGDSFEVTDADLWPPETAALFHKSDQWVLANNAHYHGIERGTARNETRYWLVSKFPIPDNRGRPAFIGGMALDVTESKNAELALQESEERFRDLLEGVFDGISIHEKGVIIHVNRGLADMLGYRPDEMIGRNVLDFLADNSRELVRQKIAAADQRLYEATALRKDGTPVEFEIIGRLQNFHGRPVRVTALRDISERKRAQDKIRQSERLLAETQRLVHLGSWEWNIDGETVHWSDELYRIYGYEPQEFPLTSDSILKHIHPEDRERVMETILKARENHLTFSFEHGIKRVDGTERILHIQGQVISDAGGKAFKMIGTTQDITERRRLEEQLRQAQKMEAIGRLAGGIAHDFNNILTAILGYSDLLLEQLPDWDSKKNDALEIKKAGERAQALTQQLLAFSRKQMLRPVVIDLNEVISDMEKMLARLIGEHVRLVTRLDPALERVRLDRGQIEQVILNLAINGRDAMPEGGQLTIRTGKFAPGEILPKTVPLGAVMLEVTDTGMGMDKEIRSKVFEPFFTTKEKEKGTGLGLSTVYGIVKQSGGDIEVESDEEGTTFRIYFPAAEEPTPLKPDRRPARPQARGAETILLVEDEPAVRSLARRVLQMSGYAVLDASNAGEAMLICQNHSGPIHLLITDVVMPQMSGRQLAQSLSPLRPEMKIIFMSGYADDVLDGDFPANEVPFLGKPFTADLLLQKVRDVLK
ncbi:MAG TPA: PAS domain S-box protein [Acidobacteriota bacterium]|jgi:PAS domain S-box-containing protein